MSAPPCPYCGSSEREVFVPDAFAGDGLAARESSLWCPHCLHHSFADGIATRPSRLAALPSLSLAGYADAVERPGILRRWWSAIRSAR